ncbi:MAG: hypothetical protein ABSD75_16695 [Terriglobales bacterium]
MKMRFSVTNQARQRPQERLGARCGATHLTAGQGEHGAAAMVSGAPASGVRAALSLGNGRLWRGAAFGPRFLAAFRGGTLLGTA